MGSRREFVETNFTSGRRALITSGEAKCFVTAECVRCSVKRRAMSCAHSGGVAIIVPKIPKKKKRMMGKKFPNSSR
jgi:hypothetical protein